MAENKGTSHYLGLSNSVTLHYSDHPASGTEQGVVVLFSGAAPALAAGAISNLTLKRSKRQVTAVSSLTSLATASHPSHKTWTTRSISLSRI